jgi:hypothetical protein
MTEAPADTHEWVSFEDPDEQRTWFFDVTFLLSRWTCIFGAGCQGVLTGPTPELEQGCCSYGAHFTGPEDLARLRREAKTLGPEQWQFRNVGRRRGITQIGADGTRTTRLVADACVFLNRPGFPGGAGCALHRGALEEGRPPLERKPDVCWQLPLRREDKVEDDGRVTSTIRQWDRRHWGDGGAEFAWWCTEAPEAFVASEPVYRHMASEIRAMTSPAAYGLLESYLDGRAGRASLPHPVVRRAPGG